MLRSLIAAAVALAFAVAPPSAHAFGFGLADRARSHLGKTAAQLGLPGRLWCADFMNMITAGGTGSRRADSYLRYGSPASYGCMGCIAVIAPGKRGRWHVGVVTGYDGDGDPIIVSGNHNRQVGEGAYPRRRVRAYRQ